MILFVGNLLLLTVESYLIKTKLLCTFKETNGGNCDLWFLDNTRTVYKLVAGSTIY